MRLIALMLLAACAPTAAHAQPRPTVVIKAARLFDGRGDQVIANGAVIVVDGKIQEIGRAHV